MSAEPRDLVTTYLEDHRAGAAGGVELARRIAERYGDEDGFETLIAVAAEIREDQRSLDAIREGLGADGGCVKRLLAVVGQQLGQLKLNGTLLRQSPLSRVLELEALIAGVHGKQRGWVSLRAYAGTGHLAGVDLDELVRRAARQLDTLEHVHAIAAEIAFGGSGPRTSSASESSGPGR